jgi:hypothetical protein
MGKAKSEQCSHGVVQRLAVTAVQLGDSEEDEGERYGVEKVGLASGGDLKGVGLGFVGRICGVFLGLRNYVRSVMMKSVCFGL